MKKREFIIVCTIYFIIVIVLAFLYGVRDEYFYSGIAILYTFSQLILSDTFLSVHNITVNNKKELQDFRLSISNISISFLIVKLFFSLCHIPNLLDKCVMYDIHRYHDAYQISKAGRSGLIMLLSLFVSKLLENLEEFLAKKMKKILF